MLLRLFQSGLLLATVLLLTGLFQFQPVYAQCGANEVEIGVGIGGTECVPKGQDGQETLGNYIRLIFNWGTVAISALAFLMIIFAGYRYMTSGGNPQKLESAKGMLVGAVSGVLLVIFAWVILLAINPDIGS